MADTYQTMLEEFVFPELDDRQSNVMFQQDGSPMQWALTVREQRYSTTNSLKGGLGEMAIVQVHAPTIAR